MLSLDWCTGLFLWSNLLHSYGCCFPSGAQTHEPHPPLLGFLFVYFPAAADFCDVSRFDVKLQGNTMQLILCPLFFQTVYSDCAQAAVLPEEMQSEASLHLEGALVRYFAPASAETVKYKKPVFLVAMAAFSMAVRLGSKHRFC